MATRKLAKEASEWTRSTALSSRAIALAAAIGIAFGPTQVQANPQGGVVSAGQANIASSGNQLTVNQSTSKAIIDWRSFNIASNESTTFNQPSSSSLALNRVNDVNPSSILGQLTANGTVVIVNPNGVFFGQGSKVDVSGLIASTADIANNDFMAGNMNFSKPGNPNASVVNQGTITAADAGLVGLVAPSVENNGVINARLGKVSLASGDTFTLDLAGDQLIQVAVASEQLPKQLASNTGTIKADGGTVAMTAAAARNVVDSLVSNSGQIQANSFGSVNGHIMLYAAGSNAVPGNLVASKGQKSGTSTVVNSGKLLAKGNHKGTSGGAISLLADNVSVLSGSVIDASGDTGGGTIKIGGDFHGAGATPTAINTTVESGAQIFANAITSGNGGNVTVWADQNTIFTGLISAKGGASSGNGGYVETSGHQVLSLADANGKNGVVDASAPNGNAGTWLLDPADLNITSSTNNITTQTNTPGAGSNTYLPDGTVATSNILASTINSALNAGTNVYLTTGGDSAAGPNGGSITISSFGTITAGGAGNASLTISAYNNLTVNAPITLNGSGVLTLTANTGAGGGTITNNAALTTGTGAINLSAYGVNGNSSGTITTSNGAVNITTAGSGTNTFSGNITAGSGLITTTIADSTTLSGIISNSAGVIANGAGTLTLSGVNVFTGGLTIDSGTVIASTSVKALGGNGTGNVTLGDGLADGKNASLYAANSFTIANPIILAAGSNGTLTIGQTAAPASGAVFSGGVTGADNLTINNLSATGIALTLSTGPINNAGTVTNVSSGSNAPVTISSAIGSNVTGVTDNSSTSALTISGAINANSTATTLTDNAGTMTVSGGTTGSGNLVISNNSSTANGITFSTTTLNNTGTITNSGTGTGGETIPVVIGSNVTNVIENSATSALTLSGNNAFGALTIDSGTVTGLTSGNAFGAGNITLGNTSGSANATLLGGTNGLTFANAIVVNAGNTGALTIGQNGGVSDTFTGGVTGNNSFVINAIGSPLIFNTGAINNVGTVTNISNGNVAINSVIGTNVTGVIENSSTSGLTLSGNNTFSGGVTILSGRVFGTASNNAFGTGNITLGNSAGGSNDATLEVDGPNPANPIVLASNTTGTLKITTIGWAPTFTGGVTGNNNLTISDGSAGCCITFSTGAINNTGTIINVGTGAGAVAISSVIGSNVTGVTENGTSPLILSNSSNAYTGNTTITAGTIQTTAANVLNGTALVDNGTLDMDGHSQSIGALSGSGTINSTAGNGITLTSNSSSSGTFSGLIENTGGSAVLTLTKAGSGTLTLSDASNSYSGGTNINGGILNFVTGALGTTGNITFGGGELQYGTGTTTDLSSRFATTSSPIYVDPVNNNVTFATAFSGSYTGGMLLNDTGSGSLILSGNNSFTGGLTIDSGTLIGGTSTNPFGAGNITLGNSAGGSANATLNGGINFQVVTFANPIVLASNTTGTLTIGTNGGSQPTFSGGVTGNNNLALNDPGGNALIFSTGAINNTGTVTNTSTGSGSVSITSAIGSNVTNVIENSSTSSLNLSGNNAFGNLTILSGTVSQSGGGATSLGAGDITLGNIAGGNSNATLFLSAATTSANHIVLASNTTGTLTIANNNFTNSTLTGGVTGNNNLTINNTDTTGQQITFSTGSVNNAGSIINAGTGTSGVTISSAIGSNVTGVTENSSTSALTISGAITANSTATTLTDTAGTMTVTGGTTGSGNIVINNNTSTANGITFSTTALNNTGTITNSGTGTGGETIPVVIGSNVTGVTENSSISSLTLSQANTYTGNTTIKSGTLQLGNATAASSGTITVGDSTGGSNNASLQFYDFSSLTFANAIVLASNTTGTLTVGNAVGNNSFSGGITGNNNLTITDTLSSLTFNTGSINNAGSITYNSGNTVLINAVVGSNVTGVIITGGGSLSLTAADTYTGNTTIKAGTLQLANAAAAGSGTIYLGDTSGSANASVYTANGSIANPIVLQSGNTGTLTIGLDNFNGSFSFTGGVTGSNNLTLSNNDAFGTLTFSTGAINNTGTVTNVGSGTSGVTISSAIGSNVMGITENSSTSTLQLSSSSNAYTGTTTITLGTIQTTAANVLNGTSLVDNGTLDMDGHSQSVGALSGSGTITSTATGTIGLTTNSSSNTTFSGTYLVGSATSDSLVKQGSGTLTLSGTNTYNGATTISGGAISISVDANLGAAPGSATPGSLTLNGGTLDATASFTLNANRGIALGASNGIIDVGSGDTLAYGGNITGMGNSLTMTDTGTLSLGGANTFTGGLTILSGTVYLGRTTSAGTGTITLGNTSGNANASLLGNDGAATFANAIVLNSGTTGTLTIGQYSGNASTFSGGITGSNNVVLSNTTSGGEALTFATGVINNTGTVTDASTGTNAPITVSAVIGPNVTGVTENSSTSVLTLSGANSYTGATTVSAGTLQLGANNTISSSSALTVGASGTFDLHSFNESLASVADNGSVTFGTGNTLTTSGAQSYNNGTVTGSGISMVSTGSGAINLGASTWSGSLSVTTNSGGITFSGAQTLGANGLTAVSTSGNITLAQNAKITSTASSGNSIVLATGGNFIDNDSNDGAAALSPGSGTARYLVWSTNPANDTGGGLVYSFKQYNATYGVTSVSGTGNGLLYTLAPSVTASLTGTVSKTYDSTLTATLTSGNYSVSGAVDGDTVTLNNPASGTFDTKNVGAGKTVSVSGIGVSSASNGSETVYGYQMSSSSASAAIGTITAANITVSGLTASNRVYDTTTTDTLGGSARVTALGSDTVTLSGTAAGNFANKNVGNGKAVTVTGLSLSGADAGNYTLVEQGGLTANITAANLTVSGLTASNKVYNTTTTDTLGGSASVTALGGDSVSLSGTAAGNFADKNVGNGKAVTVTGLGLSGADAGNYTLVEQAGLTANITPASLTASLTGTVSKPYDGTTTATLSSGNYSLSGVLGSDIAHLNDPLSGAYDTKDVGTGKTVSVNGLALLGADAGNYTLASTTISGGIGIITEASLSPPSLPSLTLPPAVAAFIDERAPQQLAAWYEGSGAGPSPGTTMSTSVRFMNRLTSGDMRTLNPQAGLDAYDLDWWDELVAWWRKSRSDSRQY